jgi:hypothetical protein
MTLLCAKPKENFSNGHELHYVIRLHFCILITWLRFEYKTSGRVDST